MFSGGVGNVVFAPVSELLARLLVQITEIVSAAKDVLIDKESFAQLSSYLERITPILIELQEKVVMDASSLNPALQCLERELKKAKELINTCTYKSKFYILIKCRSFVKRLQGITHEIGRALSLIPLTNLNLSTETKEVTKHLYQEMQVAHFKAAVAEEEIVSKIDSGIQDGRKSSNFANDLLAQIATAVGVPVDPHSLKKELDEFKKEKEAAQLHKSYAEALHLEQIISLLSWSDIAFSASQREREYKEKRISLGSDPVPPLQSFYCPITREVMDDPVDISSGQTFERSAIVTWFNEGSRACPITNVDLETLDLKPNVMLQRSIQEWRDRNTVIRLASMRPRLQSEDEELVIEALLELQTLCQEKTVHRHWIAAEGLIPVVVGLLGSSKRNVRKKALVTLCILVKNNNEIKVKVSDAGAITFAVRSLARDIGEARQAVALLLEISKDPKLCKEINEVQGCILLLVTMMNGENPQAAADARELLENFSTNDDNVVLMAEANYFKPLVHRLSEESNSTKVLMAKALSRMALTDQSRAILVNEGVLNPLVTMASMGNQEAKSAALGAFQNLSSLPENMSPMIKAGVVQPLLNILFTVRSVVTALREKAAATFANLAVASTSFNTARDLLGNFRDSNETIYQFLSLLKLTGPTIQGHLLRALTGICCHPGAADLRTIMRDAGAIEVLLSFYQASDSEVRCNAIKLLCCLTQDGGDNALAEKMEQSQIEMQSQIEILLNLVSSSSSSEEEKAAAMGILSNLPVNHKQVTDRMLQADALSVITSILTRCANGPGRVVQSKLVENAVRTLIRFTLPTDLQLQKLVADHDAIPLLVQLLSLGTPETKCLSAVSLGQFSESTLRLSTPVKNPKGWWCCSSPPEPSCKVHGGICTVKGSFCLLEADAISALVQILMDEHDGIADEAALGALATLLYDECWERGVEVIAEAKGIRPIVRLLTTGTAGAQEKAVWILEKLFRKEKYKLEYGNAAQMPLIALTQNGTNATRPLAAKILAHLNILHDQSSYF